MDPKGSLPSPQKLTTGQRLSWINLVHIL